MFLNNFWFFAQAISPGPLEKPSEKRDCPAGRLDAWLNPEPVTPSSRYPKINPWTSAWALNLKLHEPYILNKHYEQTPYIRNEQTNKP